MTANERITELVEASRVAVAAADFDAKQITEAEACQIVMAEDAAKEAARGITEYDAYMADAEKTDDEDEAFDIVKKMRKAHEKVCQALYELGDKAAVGAHIEAFTSAKNTIMAPYKKNAFA